MNGQSVEDTSAGPNRGQQPRQQHQQHHQQPYQQQQQQRGDHQGTAQKGNVINSKIYYVLCNALYAYALFIYSFVSACTLTPEIIALLVISG